MDNNSLAFSMFCLYSLAFGLYPGTPGATGEFEEVAEPKNTACIILGTSIA